MFVLLLKMRFQAKSAAVLGACQFSVGTQEAARHHSIVEYLQIKAIGEFRVRALTQEKSDSLDVLQINRTL